MSKKEIQNENSQVSRLVSRLAEFKLTQERTPPQENTSTRDSSFVPTQAQLAYLAERVLVFCAECDGEPMPSPEQIYQTTIEIHTTIIMAVVFSTRQLPMNIQKLFIKINRPFSGPPKSKS